MQTPLALPALPQNPATLTRQPGATADSFMLLGQPAADYHADRSAQSCSLLKPMLISPAHYLQALVEPVVDTEAKLTGTVLHALVMEPHRVDELVAVYPDSLTPRDKAVREFKVANRSRLCLPMSAFDLLRQAAQAVLLAPFRGRAFGDYLREALIEPSVYYRDPSTGVLCRTRPDVLHPEFTFDIKTSRHVQHRLFRQDALAMHYDMQSYMYSLARALLAARPRPFPFVFVQVELAAPHSVRFLTASTAFLENGQKKYQSALGRYLACNQSGLWPSCSGEGELDLEPWDAFVPTPL